MKTYRNDKFCFVMEIPEDWSSPEIHTSQTSLSETIVFRCKYFEAFEVKVERRDHESKIEQIEDDQKNIGIENHYASFDIGRITVDEREHVWVRHYLGSGKWEKKYILIFSGVQYTMVATCFYQNKFLDRESIWDKIVQSFRINPLEESHKETEETESQYSKDSQGKNSAHSREENKTGKIRSDPPLMPQGMKTYRNDKYGFEIDFPDTWEPAPKPPSVLVDALVGPLPPGMDKDCFQYGGRDEALNFEIAPLSPEPLLEDTETEFRLFTRDRGYTNLIFGRIIVGDKEHVCASYFINDFMGPRWNKKYMVVFGEIEYALTFTCNDPKWFAKREKDWDAIIQTFRLSAPVDETGNLTEKAERDRQKRRTVVQKRVVMRQDFGDLFAKAFEANLMGQSKKARDMLEACLREDPAHVEAHKLLAAILQGAGDHSGAIRHLREVERLDPSDLSIRYKIAQAAAESGIGVTVNKKTKEPRLSSGFQNPPGSLKNLAGVGDEAEQTNTLDFSNRAYLLIEALAFLTISASVGFRALFSYTSAAHQPLSNAEFYLLYFVLLVGIGAFVREAFLLGIAFNDQLMHWGILGFDRLRRAMLVSVQKPQTIGDLIFSEYTRMSRGNFDAFGLQVKSIFSALAKILVLPLFLGSVKPIYSIGLGALFILPGLIYRRPLPVSWYAGCWFLLFVFCYRALSLETEKRKGIGKTANLMKDRNIILKPPLSSLIRSASTDAVSTELIEKLLSQESILLAIKSDLMKTGQIGFRETWRLGLITADQDRFDFQFDHLTRKQHVNKVWHDYNFRSNLSEEIPLSKCAILNHVGAFNLQFSRLFISWMPDDFKDGKLPGKVYRLETKLNRHEFINFRNIQMDAQLALTEGRSRSLPQFLQEEGFPLKTKYTSGDPLTTERGGTIVISEEKVKIISPQYFVQRRLMDDRGNLIYLGLDESFSPGTILQVKMRPSVSEKLIRCVKSSGYIPILRYRSFPYKCDYMLPILDTPISASGWADLFIDPQGRAKLYIAKDKTVAEWYEMLNKLRQLLYDELAKKDNHLLGLTQDQSHLNNYLAKKYAILADYYLIQDWEII